MTNDALDRDQRLKDRIEFAATVLMAVAAIFTAWAAFQATKWSGEQADGYSRAAAARTEAVRSTTNASLQTDIDVEAFLAWLAAYERDLSSGAVDREGAYVPDPSTSSGFLADRFRDEFKPAFAAWIASRPVVNAEAAGTPFELPEYQLAASAEAERLEGEAEAHAKEAREANQRGDNYILLTVLFATALFFAAMSGRLDAVLTTSIAFATSVALVVLAVGIMATFPIKM